MKLRRVEIFLLQFTTGAIDNAVTALLLMLKLGSDRLEEFAASLARQRTRSITDRGEFGVRKRDHGGISVPPKR